MAIISLVPKKILELLVQRGAITPKELESELGVSAVTVHSWLKKLVSQGKIIKQGRSPSVVYTLVNNQQDPLLTDIGGTLIEQFIDANYLYVSPSGQLNYGVTGFLTWCSQTKQYDIKKTALDYVSTLKKYEELKVNHLINATQKVQDTYKKDTAIDALYYTDFYNIERFGKTLLGSLVLYSKQNTNRELFVKIKEKILPSIESLLQKYTIDTVGFVPPSVQRQVQLQKIMPGLLDIPKPHIVIKKITGDIRVPQKTLSKPEDRLENARTTFYVEQFTPVNTVLLIDDAVGSGATLQEISRQIKQKKLAKTVICYAYVGSLNGFVVIKEA
jgi:DNA-binding transcriptional ArsR family regulator